MFLINSRWTSYLGFWFASIRPMYVHQCYLITFKLVVALLNEGTNWNYCLIHKKKDKYKHCRPKYSIGILNIFNKCVKTCPVLKPDRVLKSLLKHLLITLPQWQHYPKVSYLWSAQPVQLRYKIKQVSFKCKETTWFSK